MGRVRYSPQHYAMEKCSHEVLVLEIQQLYVRRIIHQIINTSYRATLLHSNTYSHVKINELLLRKEGSKKIRERKDTKVLKVYKGEIHQGRVKLISLLYFAKPQSILGHFIAPTIN